MTVAATEARKRWFELLTQAEKAGKTEEATLIKRISPIAWRHVNFLGRFEFQRRRNEINVEEIINTLNQTRWQQTEVSGQSEPPQFALV